MSDQETTSLSIMEVNKLKDSSSRPLFEAKELTSKEHYEELFDSGYNSNVQSKTFLDLESEPEVKRGDVDVEDKDGKMRSTLDTTQPWVDSGVGITDSGLGINEDDNCELQSSTISKSSDSKNLSIENKDLLKIWLKQNSEGDTLLHLAIIEGLEDVACSIIRNISDSKELLNSYNYLYQTPLHLAVLKRQLNVIYQLILCEVSLTFQDNFGNTPLHIACKYSLTDVVQLFFSTAQKSLNNAKIFEIRNYDGDTCLHLAAFNNDFKTMEILVASGANVNVQEGKSGKTVLHCAVESLNVKLVGFMLNKCNADVQVRSFGGDTAMHLIWKMHSTRNEISPIAKSKINKIVKMLLEHCNERKISLEALSSSSSESEFSSDEE